MDASLFLADLPPHADAGSDMMVTLPTTHVVLYGNRSTDDRKIISYRWTKITGGSVSMQVRTTLVFDGVENALCNVWFNTISTIFQSYNDIQVYFHFSSAHMLGVVSRTNPVFTRKWQSLISLGMKMGHSFCHNGCIA